MKLVYVCSSEIPSRAANAVHVMRMCAGFAEAGHDVELLAVRGDGEVDPFQHYGVPRQFRLTRLPAVDWDRRSYLYGLWQGVLARLRAPDLVYGRLVPACFVAAAAGCSVVLEYHAPVARSGALNRFLFERLIRHRRFRHLVVISEALRRIYLDTYPELAGRIVVAHDGADLPPERADQRSGGSFCVGYVGSLNRGRGIELMVALAERCPWATFEMIGGDPSEVEEWKARTSHIPGIRFRGFLAPSEAVRAMAEFDVALAPYRSTVLPHRGRYSTSEWMSPLKLFEYMSTGAPIIASDLPVLHEIIEHERSALFCPADDPAAWVDALARLRDDPGLRKRLGNAARERLIRQFTWRERARIVLTPPAECEGAHRT